ncbi:hypothetical protein BW723_15880 [Polaribacter reichenbachii]|uniref:Uncharacterized protein n=1 Tax=Polaribacter reichenbachii TaxID=996801 RepID=A0A1B8U523_9FLAO|nr:hypothetical protein [Polaribacter reichenbachii]APZ47679.1 hypothetical protein BW723_15880 [Polaribacter reichenbachii]AUC18319.1 hypothetical protein BTO17_06325 [Polaribacter reichenbachii]OBY66968.1 hypothetical protein LPB301_03905 [Polaribacter reichenbachii]
MDLRKIARNLERERCSKHNEKPKATPKRDSIDISCCCEEFRTKLTNKMSSEIKKEVENDLKKAFKGFGK